MQFIGNIQTDTEINYNISRSVCKFLIMFQRKDGELFGKRPPSFSKRLRAFWEKTAIFFKKAASFSRFHHYAFNNAFNSFLQSSPFRGFNVSIPSFFPISAFALPSSMKRVSCGKIPESASRYSKIRASGLV